MIALEQRMANDTLETMVERVQKFYDDQIQVIDLNNERLLYEIKEDWKVIPGYVFFEVSTLGRVREKKTGNLMKQYDSCPDKRYRVILYEARNRKRKNELVHRLVAKAFIRKPHKKNLVCHKDGNYHNNCVHNLYWGDPFDNAKDLQEEIIAGKKFRLVVTDEIVKYVFDRRAQGATIGRISNELAISHGTVKNIVYKKHIVVKRYFEKLEKEKLENENACTETHEIVDAN